MKHQKKRSQPFESSSVSEKLFRVLRSVLPCRALLSEEQISAEQPVEINQDHDVHDHHGGQKESAVVQPRVIVDDVPGEVELCAQAKCDVGQQVGKFVDVEDGGRLALGQLQHQPQVEGYAVDLHKESYDGTGYVQLSVQGVQETRDHLKIRGTQGWHCC